VTDSGWFADPAGKVNTFRWWDGRAWTRWLSADPTASGPGAEGRPTEPTPTPAVVDPVHAEGVDLVDLPPPDPVDRVVRLPTAAAIVVAVVLLTVVAVGAIVSLTTDRPLTGPPVGPPPPTQTPSKMSYDPGTRKVSFEEMQFIAPRAPFVCNTDPQKVSGTFIWEFGCTADVHRNYDKKNGSWVTAVGMGSLDDRLQASDDLATIASQTFAALLPPNYSSVKATVKKRKIQRLTGVAPVDRAVLLSADVHFSKPGLATKYDRVVLVVVKLQSGQHVAWYAMRANDSPKDVVKALEDSTKTVTAR
jgi:Protein of unknown function (DUF2510)